MYCVVNSVWGVDTKAFSRRSQSAVTATTASDNETDSTPGSSAKTPRGRSKGKAK